MPEQTKSIDKRIAAAPSTLAHAAVKTALDPSQNHQALPGRNAEPTEAMYLNTPQDSAVATILSLPIGGRYIEEKWGPYLMSDTELVGGKYPTISWRLLVERDGLMTGESYLFEPQYLSVGGKWEPTDFGMTTDSQQWPYRRWANPQRVEETLNLMRAMLDLEGAEALDDSARERERYGITDAHLRNGTLSEATVAGLEDVKGELKVAA